MLRIISICYALLIGLVMIVPITFLQMIIPLYMHPFLRIFLVNGFIEESVKMFCLFFLYSKKINFKTFFILSIIAGFSLAVFENVIYVLRFGNFTALPLLRFFTAIPIHLACIGLSSVFVWNIKHKLVTVLPYVCAIIFHAVYNIFVFSGGIFYFFSFATVIFASSFMFSRISAYLTE